MVMREHLGTASQGETRRAAQAILRELMNALLSENVFGILELMMELDAAPVPLTVIDTLEMTDLRWMLIPLAQEGHGLVFAVTSPWLHRYQLASVEIAEIQSTVEGVQLVDYLTPTSLMEHLGQYIQSNNYVNINQFVDDLQLSEAQTERSLEAFETYALNNGVPSDAFVALERWAAFRDRPFHPTARAKRGWDLEEYQRYGAEFQQSIELCWIAVRRGDILSSNVAQALTPAETLLSPADQRRLVAAFDNQGISTSDYMAIPVHPWHLETILLPQYQAEIASRAWIPLDLKLGTYTPTSSVRSLAPLNSNGPHVKLPVGIVALGAVRYLPALYLVNGQKARQLLESTRYVDPTLNEQLQLCDESHWWAYFPHGTDFFDDRPRHLSCLIRHYPQPLNGSKALNYVPMSALAVVDPACQTHFFDTIIAPSRGDKATQALGLFREICDRFFGVVLRLLRLGIVPEIHGQNVVLTFDHGRCSGLLLRDFDTTRLYLPWVEAAGLKDPEYIVKPNRPNSLYNGDPADILQYVQTLGIQVNLYAIIDALIQRYRIREIDGWRVISVSLKQNLHQIDFTATQRQLLEERLFRQPTWPTKLCITPLLEQRGGAIGSMPSGTGQVRNPLFALEESGI